MRMVAWLCVVMLGLGAVPDGQAQKAPSEGGEIVIPLKKPGGPTRVSGMASTKVCPEVRWSEFDAQRTMAADGSVHGVAGDEGSWRVQRCTHQGVSWSFAVPTKPAITLDGTGHAYVVSQVRGARNIVEIRKLTPKGELAWRTNVSSTGKQLYVQGRPGSRDGSVYIAAATDGLVVGASPLGKGRPSLSKYNAKGKRVWTTYLGEGQYGFPFDVDSQGNAFAVTASKGGASGFVKVGPTGKVLFNRKIVFKKGSPGAGIRAVRVDRASGDPYLLLSGPGENDYGAVRLRPDGGVVWAQMARLKHESGGGEESFIDAGVVDGTLIAFQTYAFETYDNPDAFPDDQYELLALGFRVADGRVKFAKTEWYSSLMVDDTGLLGDVFVLPGKVAVPASVSTSFKVGAEGKPQLPWLTPLPRPSGDYFAIHKVSYFEEGEEKVTELADVMTIKHAGKANLRVKANFAGGNFSECSFEGTMTPAGPNTWTYSAKGSSCVVKLVNGADQVSIQGSDACDAEWCGARATLGGVFPTADRKPVGSYEWPQL